jgi:hypothetical protein
MMVLVLTPSVQDPVVQAKMQAIDDEELALVEAEAGLTVGLNITAYSSATSASLGDSLGEYVNLPSLNLFGNGVNSQGFTVSAALNLDIGTNSGRPYVYLSNIALPAGNFGLSLFSSNVNVIEGSGNRTLGNVGILDVFLGRTVTTVNATAISPALANVTAAWLRIGPHASGGGLEGVGELGGYINNIRIDAGGGTPGGLSILGTYIYSAIPGTTYTSATPTTWSPGMQGNGLLGGSFRTYYLNGNLRPTTSNVDTLLSLDIGTNGSSLMKLSLPMAATIKIRAFSFDGITSFGPIMLDNVIFYRQDMYLRNL